MAGLYEADLAYIHAVGFETPARSAAPEITRRLRSAPAEVRHVVDAGCGSGALTAALVAAGFEVTGIDASAELLALARTAVPAARFVQASMYEADLPQCEAIVAVGEPLTYHSEPANADALVESFFRKAASTLPPGGVFVFDIIEPGQPSLAGRRWASADDWAVLSETTEDLPSRTLARYIETFRAVNGLYRRGREVHRVRLFDAEALSRQLETCGFAVETGSGYGGAALPPRRRAFFCTRLRPV